MSYPDDVVGGGESAHDSPVMKCRRCGMMNGSDVDFHSNLFCSKECADEAQKARKQNHLPR